MKNFDCQLEMIKILFGKESYYEVDRLLNINTTAIYPSEFDELSGSVFDVREFSDVKTNCISIAEHGSVKHTIMVNAEKALFVKAIS